MATMLAAVTLWAALVVASAVTALSPDALTNAMAPGESSLAQVLAH